MATISFDLDGVLQRSPFRGDRPDGVWGHISRVLAPYVTARKPKRAVLELIFDGHRRHMQEGEMVAAHDWDEIVAEVSERLGYPGKIDVAALVRAGCEVPGLAWAYEGATACLQTLKAAGHTLVSITNGFYAYQEPVQKALGLLPFYAALITPDRARFGKPETGIFRAAEPYGPRPYVHVGDTLPHDIAGAKGAGWLSIYIVQPQANGYTPLPPELAALPPHRRPAESHDWLATRLEHDQEWHSHPPVKLHECIPDAIVRHLDEVPTAIAALLGPGAD